MRRWAWLLLLTALLGAGCWDRREIEERSLVLAVGFDPCPPDVAEPCALVATRQVAIPGRIPLGPGEGPGSDAQTVEVVTVPGISGPESAARAQAMLSREIRSGHIRVLVISADFARQGLDEFMDYTRRVPEAPRLLWVVVSEGAAEDVLRAQPELEPLPALFLSDMIQDAVSGGRLPNINLGEFTARLSNRGEDPVVPLIRMAGPNDPELAGLAVFRGSRLVGTLSSEENVTLLQMRGVKRGSERIEVDLPNGRRADLTVFNRNTQWQVNGGPGRLNAEVRIKLEAGLTQVSPEIDSTDPETLDQIEQAAARQVKQQAADLVVKAQGLGADIFGVGERVRGYMPDVWRAIPDWKEAFTEIPFRFSVEVHLRRTGMANQ